MNITELMNYNLDNPRESVNPYTEIAIKISQNQNMSEERLEQASLWISLTDNEEAKNIIDARLEEMRYTHEEGFAKAA